MRLDRFLKESRLIKRRTQANKYCKEEYVRINNKVSKPSKNIKTGDRIEISYPNKILLVEVLEIPEKGTPKSEAKNLYKILKEEERSIWD